MPFQTFFSQKTIGVVGLLLEKQHLNKMNNIREAYNAHDSGTYRI